MSEQTEFAALLFGNVPELPAETSSALLDQTFADTPEAGDGAYDTTAGLIPDDFDAFTDDTDLGDVGGTGDTGDVGDVPGDDGWGHPGDTDPSDDLADTGHQVAGDDYDTHHGTTGDDAGFDSVHGLDTHTGGGDDGWSGELG